MTKGATMIDDPIDWLRQAVDYLVEVHADNPGADIEAVQTKVQDCVVKYEARYVPFGERAIEEARIRLAEAFLDKVQDAHLSRDIYEEIRL
jgi:hypothetical protein